MKRFIPIITFLFITLSVNCQNVKVTGTLFYETGSPLPGANVIIKGDNVGTISDLDGYYELNAPVGATLVINCIGYKPIEMVVDESGKAAAKNKRKKPLIVSPQPTTQVIYSDYSSFSLDNSGVSLDHDPENGVAIMSSENTFKIRNHHGKNVLQHVNLNSLKLVRQEQSHDVSKWIYTVEQPRYYYKPRVYFSTRTSVEKVSRLPEFQHLYAQGRPVAGEATWQGPETGELFAWGPKVENLEYDGSRYAFDKNGRLAAKGTGNGQAAQSYHPKGFFRTGFTTKNALRIKHKIKGVTYHIDLKNNHQGGVIPMSEFNRNTFSGGINYKKNKLFIGSTASYSKAKGSYMGDSPIAYHLMRAVFLTPPTFDNSNGIKTAPHKHEESYRLPSGAQRSYAPNQVDNPYHILNQSVDDLDATRTMASLRVSHEITKHFTLSGILSHNYQENEKEFGVMAGSNIFPTGVLSAETVKEDNTTFNFNVNYRGEDIYLLHYDITTNYSGSLENSSVKRDEFQLYGNTELPNTYALSRNRTTHNWVTRVNLEIDNRVLLSASGFLNCFSDYKSYKTLPGGAVSGGVLLHNLMGLRYPVNFLKLYGSYGNAYKPISLVNSVTQYSTLNLTEKDLPRYFFEKKMRYTADIQPEETRTFNVGLSTGFFDNRLVTDFSWYNKNTLQAVFPVFSEGYFSPENLGEIRTRGVDLKLSQQGGIGRLGISTDITFSKYKTKVTKLYDGAESVPLGGFNFVQSVATEGQPLGVITGSKYLRNREGKQVIGPDGFPLVDPQAGIIGDPTPRWLLGLENRLAFNRFNISWLWEYRHKGDVWNGTRNTLSYYGLSKETGDQRNIEGFVYEGVDANDSRNAVAVDFANPENGLEGNQWYRYGATGVAEDAMEDGTCLRLKELKITWLLPGHLTGPFKKLKVGIFANNLLMITKYSGVDPESSLMGQSAGYGLDYFNLPSTKSYGVMVKVEF